MAITVGTVRNLWRYPVKSMIGEEVEAAELSERGLVGDRGYALIDAEEGKVVSAKDPRKWSQIFFCHAAFLESPSSGRPLPRVRVALPDGRVVTSGVDDADKALSEALGRRVRLVSTVPESPVLVEYWPDIEGRTHSEAYTDYSMPAGAFFDLATVHLLTTATLAQLARAYPSGQFEPSRFRPNMLIDPAGGAEGFVDNQYIGRTLAIGEVRIRVDGPCGRCVMTTRPQGDLPLDYGILKTVVKENEGNVGLYGSVVRGGTIRRGDTVQVE